MKIGIISDTHLSTPSEALFRLMQGLFANVSMVLHAGDLTGLDVLDAFSGKELISVHGNMDQTDVVQKLPKERIVDVKGYQIALTHGWGYPGNIEKRLKEHFGAVDAIVYGHTHRPANHEKDGVLFFNPGAFSGSYPMKRNRSVGLLTVDEHGISGEIIKL